MQTVVPLLRKSKTNMLFFISKKIYIYKIGSGGRQRGNRRRCSESIEAKYGLYSYSVFAWAWLKEKAVSWRVTCVFHRDPSVHVYWVTCSFPFILSVTWDYRATMASQLKQLDILVYKSLLCFIIDNQTIYFALNCLPKF